MNKAEKNVTTFDSQATGEKAVLAEVTKEEEAKLMETLKNTDTFKKVLNITVQAVLDKLSARPMDNQNFISLRVTSLQMAAQKATNVNHTDEILKNAEKIYKFLIGEEIKESSLKLMK